jgi:hypothetical protein
MAGEGVTAPRRPYVGAEAHECKQQAEQLLADDEGRADVRAGRAIAWALLAVAAELHIIRKEIRKGR